MAITGNGNASKEQVAKMLQGMLGLKTLPKNLDSTDGNYSVTSIYKENLQKISQLMGRPLLSYKINRFI